MLQQNCDTLSMSQRRTRNWYQKTTEQEQKQKQFFDCAHLILPWLTRQELGTTALTCKTLYEISESITRHRLLDASRSLENFPIPFYNNVDNIPYDCFIYTPSQIISSSCSQPPQRQFWGPDSQLGPDSVSEADPDQNSNKMGALGCQSVSKPSTESDLNLSGLSQLGYDSLSLGDDSGDAESGCECEKCFEVGEANEVFGCPCFTGLEGLGIASECGPSCGCGLECENRLTQRGVSVRLKIVRFARKGWGLCADQLILKGQFICEYAGELVTTKEARKRQQLYDMYKSSVGTASALLVVREHLPSGKACLRMNIDATKVGNIARFINHSCDGGNLSTALVRSSGALLPRLCFFASKDIQEGEALTFSYGDSRIGSRGVPCFCDSSSCFGTLPSERT